MSVIDKVKPSKGLTIPNDVDERLRRGRAAMRKDANRRRLAVKFWQGDHYWYVNSSGILDFLSTSTSTGRTGKPPHRIRNTYNFLHTIVEGKVSAATQRVPGYEVTPSTADPMDEAAARLSAQVATYGYDQWRVRRATVKTVTNALVQREGFAMPYFDPNVGPFVADLNEKGEVEYVGQGEVKLLTLSRSQVMWEPGVDFDESRWHAIERARVIDDVKEIPGYLGGALEPNASTAETPTDRPSENMVLVTEYLERPCPKYPKGRLLTFACGRRILPTEDYPCQNAQGEILDEPVLHRLSYTVDPEGDDRGLVEHLIDLQRTINDCYNKLLEWKNRCLNPQMKAPLGSLVSPPDDTPGTVRYYKPRGGMEPQWENPPAVPRELFQILEQAKMDMRAIASDVDVQPDPDLAARTAQQAIETSRERWQSFLGDLEEFHSRLMRHCLSLVQRHYSERRQIEIRGEYGYDPLRDFSGQDLRSQVNIRVVPGSLVTKSRQQIQQEIQMVATLFPGAISPEAAIAALHGGVGENLIKSYMGDIAYANQMLQVFRKGPDAVMMMPTRVDPELGEVPSWLPRKQDRVEIHRQVFGDHTKTPEFQMYPPEHQHLFDLYLAALDQREQAIQLQQTMLQSELAEGQGAANAAKPQALPPVPDRAEFQR